MSSHPSSLVSSLSSQITTLNWANATAITMICVATLLVGALGLRWSRTTSDFYVASRGVSPWWNASAIGGEYLSAASFLGVAGLVLVSGLDSLWFPIGYTAGYVVLLVLVSAPLRRSGAYTLPDFAEIRLQSALVRRMSALLVVGIGWLYLLPQFQASGLALQAAVGAPAWVGTLIVALVVFTNVLSGGMRSITLVQAFQYWVKVTALALPAIFLIMAWRGDGSPMPDVHSEWFLPSSSWSSETGGLYGIYSLLLALLFGTMGLPHVLVRFYTNPDGQAARRTTVIVLGLLGLFYIFPTLYGFLGRVYAAENPDVAPDLIVLLLPSIVLDETAAVFTSALLSAGAFAAFLSTSSGLSVAVAGVLSQDLLRGNLRHSVAGFRIGAFLAIIVPAIVSLLSTGISLAITVSLAFAVSASTFCPMLLLGIWWRRLTAAGAIVGMAVGGAAAFGAVMVTLLDWSGGGWAQVLLAQPAAWSVPLAFAVMIVVSRFTRGQPPSLVTRLMVRLHAPETISLDRGLPRSR